MTDQNIYDDHKQGSEISPARKQAFYFGMGVSFLGVFFIVVGFIGFVVSGFSKVNGSGSANPVGFWVLVAVGMGLTGLGRFIKTLGARGMAGAGMVLDPDQARDDLKPYSRMAGGMVKDALDGADINLGGKTEKVIMIRCQSCGFLNEENSKFCQECGERI